MSEQAPSNRSDGPSALGLGVVLIVIGALLFAGQLLGIGIDDIGWPAIVIAIGSAVLVLGLFVVREEGVTVGGTIATTVGLVLFYQNSTGHWESWAYAWALVGPAASGMGLVLWGLRTGSFPRIRNGTWGLLGGLALFVIGFLFFEGIIGISGRRVPLPEWTLPAALIAIGVVVLARGLLARAPQRPGS